MDLQTITLEPSLCLPSSSSLVSICVCVCVGVVCGGCVIEYV